MPLTPAENVHIFGIRHHGPGSARSLRRALEELQPDIVLVEGPPDAGAVLPLIIGPGMEPPVAILIYQPDQPQKAVYYPFAVFSPEWQALNYALSNAIPARFMDLPQALAMAIEEAKPDTEGEKESPTRPGEAAGDAPGQEPGVARLDMEAPALPEAQ